MASVSAFTRRRTSSSHSATLIALVNTTVKAWRRAEKEKRSVSEGFLILIMDYNQFEQVLWQVSAGEGPGCLTGSP